MLKDRQTEETAKRTGRSADTLLTLTLSEGEIRHMLETFVISTPVLNEACACGSLGIWGASRSGWRILTEAG